MCSVCPTADAQPSFCWFVRCRSIAKKDTKKAKPAPAGDKPATEAAPAADKKEKKEKGAKPAAVSAGNSDQPDYTHIDIRVGKITECKVHPDADGLYVEQIDLGEAETRTICSGLVKHVPLAEMQGRLLLVVCNLKPGKLRGITSAGMVLCTSTLNAAGEKDKVELLVPPAGSKVGERVTLEGIDDISKYTPDKQIDAKKENHAWAKFHGNFKTVNGVATYDGKVGFHFYLLPTLRPYLPASACHV